MDRIRLFSFRRASDGTGGVWWGLYDVYYYYAGGYVGFDRQDITSTTLTTEQQNDYPDESTLVDSYSPVELCVDNHVRKFKKWPLSPYAIIEDTSEVCGVVCDLAITSWEVTNASGVGVPDGEISVVSTSSNGPLEYRLDNGPVADYQIDSVFTDLVPNKIYYLRVRDAAGCIATQAVFVGVTLATYGELHRLEYVDIAGSNTKIKIFEKGYAGEYDERDAADTFLSINWNAQGDDKYKGIKGSECTVQFFSETSFEHLNLFTSDDRQYRIDIEKNDILYWRGYVLPDFYEEPYLAARYVVTLRATDGLGDLKGQYFLNTAKELIDARWTELQLIRFCLDKLDLDLPLYCGVNIFETTMNDGPDDDPLAQAFVNTKLFYGTEGEPFDMYTTIEKVLETYGARLHLTKGAIIIENVNELAEAYRRRLYDSAGVFVSSEDYDPIKAIGNPNLGAALYWVGEIQQLANLPGRRLITLLQSYGLKANLLPDGEFKASAFSSPTQLKRWTQGPTGGSAGYRQTGSDTNTGRYTGALYGNIPPKATATKGNPSTLIKRAEKISDSYGVDLPGSYMQADSFGRVMLFDWNEEILPSVNTHKRAYWNTVTLVIEVVTIAEQDNSLPLDTALIDEYSSYEICEDSFVNKFKFVGGATPVVKEATITSCPIYFGQIGFIESQPVQLYQNSLHTLNFSLEYDVIAPIDPRGGSFGQSTAIAALFLIQLRIKVGSYYMGSAGWTTIESFVYISPSDVNQFINQTFETAPIPDDGLFTVRIYRLVFNGDKKYRYENRAVLRIKNFVVTLLVDGLEVADSLLMTAKINDKFNVVPDQVQAILGDLPADNINDDAVYLGGKYVFRDDAIGIGYSSAYATDVSGTDRFTMGGSGTQPGGDFYHTGDEVWYVKTADTLADKIGPFSVIGTVTANGDIITTRTFTDGVDDPTESGRLYSTLELTEDYYLTRLWKRRGPTAGDPETPRELLRILLQNVANNFSRPSQVLRGTLHGPLSFAATLIDPNNVGRAFIPTGLQLNDYHQQWQGEWVEVIPGYTGGYPTEPDPATELRGQSTFEDGGKKLWEDGAYAKWEDANDA